MGKFLSKLKNGGRWLLDNGLYNTQKSPLSGENLFNIGFIAASGITGIFTGGMGTAGMLGARIGGGALLKTGGKKLLASAGVIAPLALPTAANIPGVSSIAGGFIQNTLDFYNQHINKSLVANSWKTWVHGIGEMLNQFGQILTDIGLTGFGNLLQNSGQAMQGIPKGERKFGTPSNQNQTTAADAFDSPAPAQEGLQASIVLPEAVQNAYAAATPKLGDEWKQTAFQTAPETSGLGLAFRAGAQNLGVTAKIGDTPRMHNSGNENALKSIATSSLDIMNA